MLRRAWQAYERVLERRPISVKVATASTLWCASDVLAQRLERRAGKPLSKLARTWGPDGELEPAFLGIPKAACRYMTPEELYLDLATAAQTHQA